MPLYIDILIQYSFELQIQRYLQHSIDKYEFWRKSQIDGMHSIHKIVL